MAMDVKGVEHVRGYDSLFHHFTKLINGSNKWDKQAQRNLRTLSKLKWRSNHLQKKEIKILEKTNRACTCKLSYPNSNNPVI